MALEVGLHGLIAFLFMFTMIVITLYKGLKKSNADEFIRIFLISELLMVCGFFIRLQFGHFYVNDHVLLFWMLLGLAVGLINKNTRIDRGRVLEKAVK